MADLLIHAGTTFTALDSDSVLRDAWVLVREGRIYSVTASEPIGRDAELIEAPDATLLPGLIDCHVHLNLSGRPDWLIEIEESYALACWRAEKYARDTLLGGFTSIRTLGGRAGLDVAMREAQRAGVLQAPRIVAGNLVVCMTGGHGNWMGREADGPDEVRKAVREQIKAGADVIKLMATGGVMTPNMEAGVHQLNYEELLAGVEEAHKANKGTASHAQGADGIKAAVMAGIDSIEHGFELTPEIVELMLERGTSYSATLTSLRGLADAPPNTIPEWARDKAVRAREKHDASFRRAVAAGVKLVLGTDAGTPFNFHGKNALELSAMFREGLDPVAALRAATRNGAELLRIDHLVGTIQQDKVADLVLCRGDATEDPTLLADRENLLAVIQSGSFVSRTI